MATPIAVPVVSSAMGVIPGVFQKEIMVCQYIHMTNSQGCMWFGGNPFAFTVPVLMAQFVIIFVFSRTAFFFLRPLKQSMISAQLIAGIIIGSSFLVTNKKIAERLFPPGGRMILETIANLGMLLHLFILGVQIDTGLIGKAGKSAVFIGVTTFVVPLLLGFLAILVLPKITSIDHSFEKSLSFLVIVNSLSSFPVISTVLTDLNILNSELGHLSLTSSLVNDMCCYLIITLLDAIHVSMGGGSGSHWNVLNVVWVAVFVVFILFISRPLILHIGAQIPEGQSMKEGQFFSILVVVLVSGFIAEVIGQPAGLGTFILGVSMPDGPPIGSALVNKLDSISTGIFLPAKIVIAGMSVNLSTVGQGKYGVFVGFILAVGYIGKLCGAFVIAVYCGLSLWNSIPLSLIMCCKGIIEVATFMLAFVNGIIDSQTYSIVILSMLILTAVARPLISYLYDPSRRYFLHRRNCILHSLPESELRVVVCIHDEDDVPAMINLLEASSPTMYRPICIFVLNLLELSGRGSAILKRNYQKRNHSLAPSRSDQIINVFSFFTESYLGCVTVQHYIAISPYASMHDDICTVALDNSAAIIIVPFHKKWTIDGMGDTVPSIRGVNQKIIRNAPCSVGILVDRGQMGQKQSILISKISFRIALLFIGGDDDREALAYSSRMVEHPNVSLSLVRLKPLNPKYNYVGKAELSVDNNLINEFRANSLGRDRIMYKEEMVNDAVGTTSVLRSMEDCCDLFIIGRHHEESSIIFGLNEWGECPELGVVGDLLATADFRFSVLVVLQKPPLLGSTNSKAHKDPLEMKILA